jgi:transcription initiation factor TFIIIB Brf1 subunit/transcription initiation factor TFIIB
MVEIKKIKVCPECGSSNITKSRKKDQVICRECGLIFEPLTPNSEKKFEKVSDVI